MQSDQSRNTALDVLRGLAIVLMVVDHVANFWFATRIEFLSLRMVTRLSMPLFAILLGYFISSKSQLPWKRLLQIAAVSAVVNYFFYPIYERAEILASFLVCYPLAYFLGRYAPVMLFGIFLFPLDSSAQWLDYPLSIVACCVAQGQVLRQYGWKIALASSAIVSLSATYLPPVAAMTVIMVPLATGLVLGAIRYPTRDIPSLSWIGRNPLAIYLAHYLILLWLRPFIRS